MSFEMDIVSDVINSGSTTGVDRVVNLSLNGETPKAVLMFANYAAVDGTAETFGGQLTVAGNTGVASGRWFSQLRMDGNDDAKYRQLATDDYLRIVDDGSTTVITSINSIAFTSNTITYQIDVSTTQNVQVTFVVFAGSDIEAVDTGVITGLTNATSHEETTGFQSDLVMFFSPNRTTGADTAAALLMTGFSVRNGNDVSMAYITATQDAFFGGSRNSALMQVDAGGNLTYESTSVVFGATSFTITTTANTSDHFAFIAFNFIDGITVVADRFNVPSSTGLQTISGLGMQPEFVMFTGVNKAIGTSPTWPTQTNLALFNGFLLKDGTKRCLSLSGRDNGFSYESSCLQSTRAIEIFDTESAAFQMQTQNEAVTNDGFELDWLTVANGNVTADVIFVAIGAQVVPVTVSTKYRPVVITAG